MKISLLTGGADRPYSLGLLSCLVSKGVTVEFIGSDELLEPDIMKNPKVIFHNLRGDQNPDVSPLRKAKRVTVYYLRLIRYAYATDSPLFHINWLNKFVYFDRIVMTSYYKALGKKIVYTAHNIDQQERDGKSSWFNQFTLRAMYGMLDHVFVHTNKMRQQLIDQFRVEPDKISVIPFGINSTLPETDIDKGHAREVLGLKDGEKVILSFGYITPYKGLEYLVLAMSALKKKLGQIRLIIVGRIKDHGTYWWRIRHLIREEGVEDSIIAKTEFIPNDQVEIYFKAADALVLPYRSIFQSGVLSLSYYFGLPVIATDVGSLREDVLEGETGFVCCPESPESLTDAIVRYFDSNLYKDLDTQRSRIRDFAKDKYSWDKVSDITVPVYEGLLR